MAAHSVLSSWSQQQGEPLADSPSPKAVNAETRVAPAVPESAAASVRLCSLFAAGAGGSVPLLFQNREPACFPLLWWDAHKARRHVLACKLCMKTEELLHPCPGSVTLSLQLAENNVGTCSFACCCTETLRDIWHKIAPKLAQRNAARPVNTLAGSAATPVHLHCWFRLCFHKRCCIFGIYLASCLEFPGGCDQGVLNGLHMLLSAFCGTGKLCQGQRCSVQQQRRCFAWPGFSRE